MTKKFKYAQSRDAPETHQQKLRNSVRRKPAITTFKPRSTRPAILEHNDKVQVNVCFAARDAAHREGQRVMNQVLEALVNDCKLECARRWKQADGGIARTQARTGEKAAVEQSQPKPKPKPKPNQTRGSSGRSPPPRPLRLRSPRQLQPPTSAEAAPQPPHRAEASPAQAARTAR